MQLSEIEAANNLVALFLVRADQGGERPFLWHKRDGAWHALSWAEAARQVCLLAENLHALGLDPGDRVVLVSENRPEWCIADLAIMAAGCVTVPTYTTNTERDHLHILDNSGARAAIVSNGKLAEPLLRAIMHSGHAEHVIGMETFKHGQEGSFAWHGWDAMQQGDPAAARAAVEQRIARIGRGDLACIIYTSGTGGAPRGVRQHHGAILANAAGASRIIVEDFGLGEEVFLSFLPLSHAYEHTGGQFLPIGLGAQIYYAEGLEKLASNIAEVRPTIMVVVPRLFEVLRSRIMKQIGKEGRIATYLMDRALTLAGRKPRLIDRPMDMILNRTLRPRIRRRFGGRIKALVSGGAPLNPDVGTFFTAMGLTLLQGYGQTEAGPVISCNRPSAGLKMDTVGPPLPGVDVKIAEDGEILCRGELVMHGYWRNPAQTAATLIDGWLHTGDIGHLDEAGRIVITDRKKDMIVNDKGDNIAAEDRGHADPAARNPPGDGRGRPAALCRRPDRGRCGMGAGMGASQWRALRHGRTATPARFPQLGAGGGGSRQPGPFGDREGAPVRLCRRSLLHRQRGTDAEPENPPPQDSRTLRRAAGRSLQGVTARGLGGAGRYGTSVVKR